MKCPHCGYENKEDAVFCTRCGKKLPVVETEESELIRLAFAYTGNHAVAGNIVSESEKNVPAVRNACIEWIRSRETLFDEKITGRQNEPLLDSFDDMEKQIVSMDYEERIVSLLHCYEKKGIPEISGILNIPESYVIGLLQDAYRKANGLHVKPYFTVKRDAKPENKKTAGKEDRTLKDTVTSKIGSAVRSRTAWKLELIVACIAAVLLGSYFGIRSYANTQYETGVDLYKSGNYEQAVSALSKAVKFRGGGDEALRYLGDACYRNGSYEDAAKQYESYQEKHPGDQKIRKDLIRTYQRTAEAALRKKDSEQALTYFQKQYALDHSSQTYIRIQAVQNGGTYTSETNGTVYDTSARPVRIVVTDADSEELYTVRISYKKGKISSLRVSDKKDNNVKINGFDQGDSSVLSVFPDLSWQMENDTYEKKYVTEKDYSTSGGNTSSVVYNNQLNSKGKIVSRTFDSDGVKTEDRYTWKNNHIVKMERTSADENLVYKNTWKKNLLQKTVITNGSLGEVGRIEYEYDASGNLTDRIESHSTLSLDDSEPFMKNRHIAYTNASEGTPMNCTVRTGDNQLAGYGTYVPGTGWIMCYIQNED